MKTSVESFIKSLEIYDIPTNVQYLYHKDNQVDLENLNQQDKWRVFVTEKGLQDVKTNVNVHSTSGQYVSRSLDFRLPPYLTPTLWHHYKLSLETVIQSLTSFHPLHLWSLCLLLQLNLSIQAVKPSYSNSIGIICQAKANAKTRLTEYLTKNYPRIPFDTLFDISSFPEDEHHPTLPVFVVSPTIMEKLITTIPSKDVVDKTPLRHPVPYSTCFLIRGKKYIAYELHSNSTDPNKRVSIPRMKKRKYASPTTNENGLIPIRRFVLMVRIVPAVIYFYTYGAPTSLSLDPLYIQIKDQIFCGLDECVYVTEDIPVQMVFPTTTSSARPKLKYKRKRKKTQ